MHHGDVFVPPLDAGLVDADVAHGRHVIASPRTVNVVADPIPQPLGRDPHLGRSLVHGQLAAQGQTQCLEQQRETAALACPRHRQLRGLAAARALHAGDVGMEPRLELKEVQVTPTAPHSIVDRLMHGTTRRTGHALAGVLDFEVDPPLGGVELDLGDVPRRLQTQCGREEGFDRRTHGGRSHGQDRGVAPPITLFVVESISTGKGIEPAWGCPLNNIGQASGW